MSWLVVSAGGDFVVQVIVTGAAGFIGSHTVRLLVDHGYSVIAIDNFHTSVDRHIKASEGIINIINIDISDWNSLSEKILSMFRNGDVVGVVHLAAIVNVVEAMRKPQRTLDVNVKGTLNILELARRLDVERIVYASSAAVYGEPKYLPVDEKHPLEPMNIYGESKAMGERLLWLYKRLYGLRPVALRYFNVYGPGMRPGPYSGVIHKFITALLKRERPVIFGDGNQTRDFVYVEDVAMANLRALETLYSDVFNIGSGIEISINKLYKLLCNIVGYCPPPYYQPPRKGDVKRNRASIKKAVEVLKWNPKVTLEEGLRRTLLYYRSMKQYSV